MSLTEEQTTAKNFQEFYSKIRPYLNGSFPTPIVNKFSKGDLYSTEEKIIGQWIDGKPIWQKTYDIGSAITVSNSGVNISSYISNLSSIARFVNAKGYNDSYNGAVNINVYIDSGNVYAVANGNYPMSKFTIQYTKTTDSPISIGDGNDYSTDEQVVGTWIDGKPLYQITVSVPSTSTIWGTVYTVTNGDYIGVKQARYYYGASGTDWINMNFANGNDVLLLATYGNNVVANMRGFTFGANNPIEMTLQYTKTTDTATV